MGDAAAGNAGDEAKVLPQGAPSGSAKRPTRRGRRCAARPSWAATCARGWRTPSTCRTARAPRATGSSSPSWWTLCARWAASRRQTGWMDVPGCSAHVQDVHHEMMAAVHSSNRGTSRSATTQICVDRSPLSDERAAARSSSFTWPRKVDEVYSVKKEKETPKRVTLHERSKPIRECYS